MCPPLSYTAKDNIVCYSFTLTPSLCELSDLKTFLLQYVLYKVMQRLKFSI